MLVLRVVLLTCYLKAGFCINGFWLVQRADEAERKERGL